MTILMSYQYETACTSVNQIEKSILNQMSCLSYLNLNCYERTTSTSYVTLWQIAKATSSGEAIIQLWSLNGTPYRIRKGSFVLRDLTKMFNAGNEPTTIEEFNARKPIVEDEYAYNEGEVIAFNGDAVKSVGDNAFNGVWYQGGVSDNDGSINTIQSDNLHTDTFRVIGGETYCSQFDGADLYLKGYFFDKSGAFIGSSDFDVWQGTKKWVAPINADSVRMRLYNGVGNITPSQAPNVMIRLDHSGWKSDTGVGYEPYWADTLQIDSRIKAEFPNGMHKWDKVYNHNGKGYIVKGTGSVDLGTLDWEIVDFNGNEAFFSVENNLGAQFVDHITHICDRYFPVTHNIYTAGQDMAIALNYGYYGNIQARDHITIRDTRYTDAASFKASLQGVMLYYELAEPTIIEYDKPFKLDYKVADFGTEELIAAQPSAPFRARTIYQFNAVDQIRENYNEIQKLKELLNVMSVQLTSLNNK